MRFHSSYHFAGAFPLPLDMGYLFLVRFNIFLSMDVQQQVVFWSSCMSFYSEEVEGYLQSPSESFRVLQSPPEDECMSFYSAILPYIKTIPKKRKCKKAKWLSEEALQIAEKRKEAKSKGEKERYTHLSSEF